MCSEFMEALHRSHYIHFLIIFNLSQCMVLACLLCFIYLSNAELLDAGGTSDVLQSNNTSKTFPRNKKNA